MTQDLELTMHHVGCLVEDIETARVAYQNTSVGSSTLPIIKIKSQRVAVCFLPAGNGTFIEFVQPDADNQALRRLLAKGQRYYHVGFFCADIEAAVSHFVESGSHVLESFESEAFNGAKCVFLINTEHQLIELMERATITK